MVEVGEAIVLQNDDGIACCDGCVDDVLFAFRYTTRDKDGT